MPANAHGVWTDFEFCFAPGLEAAASSQIQEALVTVLDLSQLEYLIQNFEDFEVTWASWFWSNLQLFPIGRWVPRWGVWSHRAVQSYLADIARGGRGAQEFQVQSWQTDPLLEVARV